MKRSKKILSALLAVIMVIPFAVSCSKPAADSNTSNTSTSDSSKPTEGSSESGAPTGERTKISWAMWVSSSVEEDNGAEERLMERMPNVEIDFMPFERATWQDQINTRVAGGDIPDIIYRDSQNVVAQYVKQGIICEVPISKAKEYAPNIYEATKEYGEEVWLAAYADGKNWGLPIMQPSVIAPFSNHWRMDMLEKVGVTEVPTTIQEAEDVFLKIIATDVNGSGSNDTYGLTFRGKDASANLFASIFAAYGVLPSKWMVNDDGTITFGWMRDEIKDGLELLRRWYDMGIIDPEFVTTDNAIFKQKVAGGNIAYHTFATWGRAQAPQGEFYLDAISGDPNARLEVGPALKGPNGDYGYMTWGSITSSTTFGSHLAKDEEKLNLCLQVVDFVSANTDDAEYVRYGVEGTDWERDENGAKVDLYVSDVNKQAQFGSVMLDSTPGVPALQDRYQRTDNAEWGRYALEGTLVPGESYIDWASFFTDTEITSVSADIDPEFLSGIIDIITGTRPLDDYEVIRQKWYDAGGQALTDEYNLAYQEGGAIMDGIIAQID